MMRKRMIGKKTNIQWLLLIVIILSMVSSQYIIYSASASGSTYYVSTSGSDSNTGSFSSPWRTIQKAANMVTQGDTVYIRGGTYREEITLSYVKGTSTSWITFQPYDSEKVVVDASGLGGRYDGIFLFKDGCSYIRITGLEIKGADDHGIFLYGGEINSIRVDHCVIHDCESSGIYCISEDQPTKYVRNVEFDYNTVYDVNNGISSYGDDVSPQEAISLSNVQGFNIHHNNLRSYGKEGIDCKSGTSSGSIHHNTISTSLASPAFQWNYHHIGIYIDGFSRLNHDISVYCNTITGYGGSGIVIGAEEGGSIENIYIYNNVISLSARSDHIDFRSIDSFDDCAWKNVYIYSNTIDTGDSDNSALRIYPAATHITNLIISNNIFTGSAYYLIYFQKMRSTETSGRVTLTNNLYYRFSDTGHNNWYDGDDKSWGKNSVLKDPKFVDRTSRNLHLQSSSPAINVGSTSKVSSSDFDGVTRPQGSTVDIGAYEYISSSSTNNPLVISGVSLSDGSTNVPISTSSLSVTVYDPEGTSFDCTIETSPSVGYNVYNDVYSGTKTCAISGLEYGTTYRWYVNATDDFSSIRRSYTFTTISASGNNPPVISGASLPYGSTNVPISTSSLSVTVYDPEGTSFDCTIETSPSVGYNVYNDVYSGTKTCAISGLEYGTTYRWYVNATDGSKSTHLSYIFTTTSDPNSTPTDSNPPGGGDGGGTSPSEDNLVPSVSPNNRPNSPLKPIGEINVTRGVNYTFTSTSIDPDGDQIRLQFDWGDGNFSDWSEFVDSNTNISFSHAWNSSSIYLIRVIAQDNNNELSRNWSISLNITVSDAQPEPPILEIVAPDNATVNQKIIFVASDNYQPEGVIVNYNWDFGDGTTKTGKTSDHSYIEPGVYQVNLTVTDNKEDTFSETILLRINAEAKVIIANLQPTSFSYSSIALLSICAIGIGMMVYLGKKAQNVLTNKSVNQRIKKVEYSIEEQVDRLILERFKK